MGKWEAHPVLLPQPALPVGSRRWSTWGSYLHKLHVAEDVDRVVGSVEVVAAAAQLGVAAPKVAALTVGGLGAVQPAAARRGAVYCRWCGGGEREK